jgi:addiction module RelE/StbE family toxin
MYLLEIMPPCEEAMRKKFRKNKPMQDALDKKIAQILENPQMFKPLGAPLEGCRRVHVLGSFVLIYDILEESRTVRLLKFGHHDEVYNRA